MPDLSSLLASADDLRVDALVQQPWCARPATTTVRETCEIAVERGFDFLPVEDSHGQILSTIATSELRGASSWDEVLPQQQPLTPDRLVARESPVLRLLERLEQHPILFTLGRGGVDGVVTIYDLNQPAAHLFGFGMALICEADVTEALRSELGEDPNEAYSRAHAVIGRRSRGLAAWKRARLADRELHVASMLTFGEKLTVLRGNGLAALADIHGINEASFLVELKEICALRNAIGHYNDDDDRLNDPRWTFERMRLVQRFADRVIARRS
jgi:hypothetical protein